MTTTHKALLGLTAILFAFSILVFISSIYVPLAYGANANKGTTGCAAASSTSVAVGNQVATTILNSNAIRAYTRIQLPHNATSTVFLAFDGTAATVANGLPLSASATSSPFIELGLNTDFPTTGAVSVITNTGSTTVVVVNCTF